MESCTGAGISELQGQPWAIGTHTSGEKVPGANVSERGQGVYWQRKIGLAESQFQQHKMDRRGLWS